MTHRHRLTTLVFLFVAACGTTPSGVDGGTDAGDLLACTMEGAMRIGECGMCGMQSQTCTSGRWTAASACLGGGVCEPASVGMRMGTRCTPEQRLCGADCTWGDWAAVGSPGECDPADVMLCGDGSGRYRLCGADCQWAMECVNP